MKNIIVIGPREKTPDGFTFINTTSRDPKEFGCQLSPFFLGPIPTYEGRSSRNMENAWQFSKVYPEFADHNEKPTKEYFLWAHQGWKDSFAHRYPNGKGKIPLYSYWKTFENGQWREHFLKYIDARKNIYFPLYARCVVHTSAFLELKNRIQNGENIALWDFDGYDHAKRKMSYFDVVHSEQYKCGHAFVIYGLLTNQIIFNSDKSITFNFQEDL